MALKFKNISAKIAEKGLIKELEPQGYCFFLKDICVAVSPCGTPSDKTERNPLGHMNKKLKVTVAQQYDNYYTRNYFLNTDTSKASKVAGKSIILSTSLTLETKTCQLSVEICSSIVKSFS